MRNVLAGLMFDNFDRCESQIEILFQLALALASRRGSLEWSNAESGKDLKKCAMRGCVVVGSQVWINDARVDFAFAIKNGRTTTLLAVECDGAAFHQATPEQKSRDRYRDARLAFADVDTLRFSGAEIVRDPFQCLRQSFFRLAVTMPLRGLERLTAAHRELALRSPPPRDELQRAAQYLTSPVSGLESAKPKIDKARRQALAAALAKSELQGEQHAQ